MTRPLPEKLGVVRDPELLSLGLSSQQHGRPEPNISTVASCCSYEPWSKLLIGVRYRDYIGSYSRAAGLHMRSFDLGSFVVTCSAGCLCIGM